MLTIIIYGLILFIVGVAGTILYDKRNLMLDPIAQAKAKGLAARKETTARKQAASKVVKSQATASTFKPTPKSQTTYKRSLQDSLVEDLFRSRPVVKAKPIKDGDLPDEAITLEDLIAKIEGLKKKK